MGRGWKRATGVAAALVALGVGIPSGAGAAPSAGASGMVRPSILSPGVAPPGSTSLGPLAGTKQLQLGIVLQPSDASALTALEGELYDPSSPLYHQWLAPGQFAAEFGPSSSEVAAVSSWLTGLGLSATVSGFTVNVTAQASRLASALGTTFEGYQTPAGQTGYVAQETPQIPSSLADGVISGIIGLNSAAPFQPELAPPATSTAAPTPGPEVDGLTPCAAASAAAAPGYYTLDAEGAAYGMGSLLADGLDGHGQTVALYELGSHSSSDVAAYLSCFGLTNPVSTEPVDGGGGAVGGNGTLEADADIEQAATQAPGASIVSYEGPDTTSGAYDTWNAIVSADTAKVVSTSWGLCEPLSNEAGYIASFATLFAQAAMQGQTVLTASGDNGSEDCYASEGSTALEVDYPSSDASVTAVGGTSLFGPGDEVVWNISGNGAGGGGISRYVADPAWQPVDLSWSTTGNACGQDCREVPDISANAGVGMIVDYEGSWIAVGGTSLAAPLVAGMVADRNQGCAATTADLAPTLYQAAAQGLVGKGLTDITSGDNDLTGTYGGADYAATAGYDPATGLGSPLAAGLTCADVTSVGTGTPGSQVTVHGLGLEHATVDFGATPAQVVSATATSATVVVPSGSGTVAVSATSTLGTGTLTASFSYGTPPPVPAVTGVSPTSGPTTGGTSVTITGTGFTGATAVKFGSSPATTFT
ncbi:MAG TPA: protease pro-enzyme activation domain-containing protein, partial [Acidimicrobiales bacterium]|nr:protease pro-enzyme activation domain-containing protein [Acidimicrobiales bacterium]